LRALLAMRQEIEIVGEAANGQQVVQMVREYEPDVVLMNGLEATRRIKACWPEVRVVVVSMYVTRRTQALAVGVDGFLSKGCRVEELLEAILDR
jgi:DNA-binding NarL/FixJ family response regulator